MAERKRSNYEAMKERAAALFLQFEQEKMIRRFGLNHDERYLFLSFVGRSYRIHRETGAISWSQDAFQTEEPAGYNEAMTIYDVLCHAKEGCRLAHQWVNVGSISAIQGGALAKGGGFFQNAGEEFAGKGTALARACEVLGGRKRERGDVAYELDLFPFLSISLCFWEADEEFSPSLQILVDKNTLDYMHYETLMFAITHLLSRLREECG